MQKSITFEEEMRMSDEIQAAQPVNEGAVAPEGTKAAAHKTKKINRMSAADLSSKIEEIEKGNLAGSTYYKHLLQRKRELGA
ncbi:MAG: hypothetical protein A2176_15615 [Spirochaetes bacterium RBG_13_51_14]|nr:MAG: hypothetical protein A2176_15615 [Spirochaetes bacterium RBG_13_51_14]